MMALLPGSFAEMIRVKKSLKKAESIMIVAAPLHYNFCRPHSGIKSKTPAEMGPHDNTGQQSMEDAHTVRHT